MSIFDKDEDIGKLILRFAVGILLLLHGIAKTKSGVDWLTPSLAQHGLPAFLRFGVYAGEIVAPILLIVGWFSRPAGVVIAINMIMAVMLVRTDAIGIDSRSGGFGVELETLYAAGALAVYFIGSGRYAISRGKGKWD